MQPWCEIKSITIPHPQGPLDTARLRHAAKDWLHSTPARLPLPTLKDYMGWFPRRETASSFSLHNSSLQQLFLKLGNVKYPIEHQTGERSTQRILKKPTVASKTDPACPCFCLQLLSAKLQWKSPRGSKHYPYINFIMQLAVGLSNVFV